MAGPIVYSVGHLTIDDLVLPSGRTDPDNLGGNSLYAALGARLCGARPEMISVLGAGFHKEAINIDCVGTSLVARSNDPAIHQRVLYGSDGSRTYTLRPGSGTRESMTPRYIGQPLIPGSAVHLAPIHAEFQRSWVASLTGDDHILTLDPHEESCHEFPDGVLALMPKVDAFMPSEHEARLLTGADPLSAIKIFAGGGARTSVVKMGARGSLVAEQGRLWHVRSYPVREVDATGAGDSFCGAFAASLARGCDALEAAQWAAAAASVVVEVLGAKVQDLHQAMERVSERRTAITAEAI